MKRLGVVRSALLPAAVLLGACSSTTTGTGAGDGTSGGGSSGTTSSSASSGSSSGDTSSSSGSSGSGGGSTGQCTGTGTVNAPSTNAPADPSGCPVAVDLSGQDLDAEVGWKCARATAGACTADDVAIIEANFADTSITSYFDLASGVSAACEACVVSKDTDPNWGPVVGTAADGGATGFINFGSCFGFVAGADCGKAIQYEQLCFGVACSACATTTSAHTTCANKAAASGGGCESFSVARAATCPNETVTSACDSILDTVRTLCGT